MPDPSIPELRRRIIKREGLVPPKVPPFYLSEQPEYDESKVEFPMTALMKYIETKYNIKLKLDIYKGSINDVCSRYGWEVDRSTVSRWRRIIRRYLIDG